MDALIPGDIGAVIKVDDIKFDVVLHDSHDEDYIHLKPLSFPKSMFGLSVETKRKGDEQRLFDVLDKLALEDSGVVAGFPVVDVRVTVCDGKTHAVDSKEIAFVTAGHKAVIEAIRAAKPLMLELVVDIEIIAPEATMGDITSDLSAKRGHIIGTDQEDKAESSSTVRCRWQN